MAHTDKFAPRAKPTQKIIYNAISADLFSAVRDTKIDCQGYKIGVERYTDKTPSMHGGIPNANSELESSIERYVSFMLLATHPSFQYSKMENEASGQLLSALRNTDAGRHDMMAHMIPILVNAIDQKAREVLASHGLSISGRGAEVS